MAVSENTTQEVVFCLVIAPVHSFGNISNVSLICKAKDGGVLETTHSLDLKEIKRKFIEDAEEQKFLKAECRLDFCLNIEYECRYRLLDKNSIELGDGLACYTGANLRASFGNDSKDLWKARLIHLFEIFQTVPHAKDMSSILREVEVANVPDVCFYNSAQSEIFHWINCMDMTELSSSHILVLLAMIGMFLKHVSPYRSTLSDLRHDLTLHQVESIFQAVLRIAPRLIPPSTSVLIVEGSTWLLKKADKSFIHFVVYFSSVLTIRDILKSDVKKRISCEEWNTFGSQFFETISKWSDLEIRNILTILFQDCNSLDQIRCFLNCFLGRQWNPSIVKEMTSHAMKALQRMIRTREQERIEILYKVLNGDDDLVLNIELASEIRKHLILALITMQWPYTSKELSNLILEEGSTEEGRQFVTNNLLKKLHNITVPVNIKCLLEAVTINDVVKCYGKETIENTLKQELKSLFRPLKPKQQLVNESTRRDCLNSNYSLLAIVYELDYPTLFRFYDEMIYTSIKDVPLDELVGHIVDRRSYIAKEAKTRLAEHISQRVRQEDLSMREIEHMVCRLKDKQFDYLRINNVIVQQIILTILDTFKPTLLTLVQVVENYHLWTLLFGCKGEHSKPVIAHKIVKHVSDMLCKMLDSLKNKTLALGDPIWIIIEQQNKSTQLIHLILDSQHELGKHSKVSQYIEDQICDKKFYLKGRANIAEFHNQTQELIEAFVCKEGQRELQDSMVKPDSTLIMNRQRIEEFWGDNLKIFMKTYDSVKERLKSRIFINTCFATLARNNPSINISIDQFCTVLKADCMKIFGIHCNGILGGELMMNTSELDVLFREIGSEQLTKELDIIGTIFNKTHPKTLVDDLTCFVAREDLKQKAHLSLALMSLVKNEAFHHAKKVSLSFQSETLTLDDWMNCIRPLRELEQKLKGNSEIYWKIVETISSKQTASLVNFLKEIANEDLRNLVDVVGNFCDIWMELMDVKQYLTPFLTKEYTGLLDTYESLLQIPQGVNIKNIPTIVNNCVSNFQVLQELYRSMATRNRITLEVIGAAQKHSEFCFTWNETTGLCDMSLRYRKYSGQYDECPGDELTDLRSRALLIMSSETKSRISDTIFPGAEEQPDLQSFVKCINSASTVTDLYVRAKSSGFIDLDIKTYISIHDLQGVEQELLTELREWDKTLNKVKQNSCYMNYFNGKQLRLLEQFFRGEKDVCEDVKLLFHFVYPHFEVTPTTRRGYKTPSVNASTELRLQRIAKALEVIFANKSKTIRPIYLEAATPKRVYATVQPGEIFVALVPIEKSFRSFPVIMQLCMNTTGSYPEPSEILFCHKGTSAQEIDLLLNRCLHGAVNGLSRLYLIVNVEQLSSETQLGFIDRLKDIQVDERGSDLLLAIIYCGTKTNHIARQFPSRLTHELVGLSLNDLRTCFTNDFPYVEVVISKYAGLGKTSYIENKSKEEYSAHPKPILISGPLQRKNAIKQLRKHDRHNSVLHFDVKEMTHPETFNVLLFELLAVGITSFGDHSYRCQHKKIFVEIANSMSDYLRNCLVVASLFKTSCLEWENFNNYVINDDVTSPEQFVCRYKKELDNGTLDQNDMTIDKCVALEKDECQSILRNIFKDHHTTSFAEVKNFLNILAGVLQNVSNSTFFSTESLKFATQGKKKLTIRSEFTELFFKLALEISARLSSASLSTTNRNDINARQTRRHKPDHVTASDMEKRYQKIAKWSESKHLLTVFNRDHATITVLYKDISVVSDQLRRLLKIQKEDLKDYSKLPQAELRKKLERVCKKGSNPLRKVHAKSVQKKYVLTPDNMLKMVLMMIQIEADIPVILMGETGCGKTMLIKYLAELSEVSLRVLHLHAATTDTDIEQFVLTNVQSISQRNRSGHQHVRNNGVEESTEITEAEEEIWLFFDEVNTCDHLGLLTEIICHKKLYGDPLPNNVVCIAACNPYCIRTKPKHDIGLDRIDVSEARNLVYRVNPLPETMMDYVWDFGSLDERDEKAYIERMVQGYMSIEVQQLFIQLLIESQNFVRSKEGTRYCVSLRDVDRCRHLLQWLRDYYLNKKPLASTSHAVVLGCDEREFRAMILAICISYHFRFVTEEIRREFRRVLTKVCRASGRIISSDEYIADLIKVEEEDLLDQMKLPPGIAKNEALKENVFVLTIAILTRLPVLLVGKPGSSKSLSMRLIEENLKGGESDNTFFTKLPAIFKLSYQGSRTSTSAGIIRVFDNASKLQREGRQPVVLIDEVGLAEESGHNPLKVLHQRLESDDSGFPPIAMVGLSNWAIDAAKMNRALFLSRPDPTSEDLFETALAIRDGLKPKLKMNDNSIVSDDYLRQFSRAYYQYKDKCKKQSDQPLQLRNFHGLRDFYSMIKYLTMQEPALGICDRAILRNFGGLPRNETADVLNTLTNEADVMQQTHVRPTVVGLIRDNLSDPTSRHLMLITKGYSTMSILQEILQDRKYILILGSSFENDFTDEYDQGMLNKIVLHMETECIVILWGLENIYGCLYDMLNQNYTKFGKKRFCRVALGPNCCISREVHPNFKCIVLMEEKDILKCDPPFLNRFEKQSVGFSDILEDEQKRMVEHLDRWTTAISHVGGFPFTRDDNFVGFHEGILPSVVLQNTCKLPAETISTDGHSSSLISSGEIENAESEANTFNRCTSDLVNMASSDGVLRFSESALTHDLPISFKRVLSRLHAPRVDGLQTQFFGIPLQKGLRSFISDIFTPPGVVSKSYVCSKLMRQKDSDGMKLVIHTYSSFHSDIAKCFQSDGTGQTGLAIEVEKLSNFASEKHLDDRLRYFWTESNATVLFIQCKPAIDCNHIVVTKWLIELYRTEYQSNRRRHSVGAKHVCFIVHLDRGSNYFTKSHMWKFDFMNNWHIFTVESIEPHEFAKADLKVMSMTEAMSFCNLQNMIKEQLLWCFNCISYTTQQREVNQLFRLIKVVAGSSSFIDALKEAIFSKMRERYSTMPDDMWEMDVALNRQKLIEYSTMAESRREVIKNNIRAPMAKIVYAIENLYAWDSLLFHLEQSADSNIVEFWIRCFMTSRVFKQKLTNLPPPKGVHCYVIDKPLLSLQFPFFMTFHEQIQTHCALLKEISTGDENTFNEECNQLVDAIQNKISDLLKDGILDALFNNYIDDLCNVLSIKCGSNMDDPQRIPLTRWLLEHQGALQRLNNPLYSLASWYVSYWRAKRDLPGQIQLVTAFMENNVFSLSKLEEDMKRNESTDTDMTYRLVTTICQQTLPTADVVASRGGILPWHKFARIVASKAAELDDNPHEYHFLMICIDFQQILEYLPSSTYQYKPLENIAKPSQTVEPIEKREVFQEIQTALCEIRSKKLLSENEVDNFLCRYIGRCLEASPHSSLMSDFMTSLTKDTGHLIPGSRSVIYTIMDWEFDSAEELPQVMSIWRNLLDEGAVGKGYLATLDNCLRSQKNIDCPLGVACCDVLREILSGVFSPSSFAYIDIGELVSVILPIVEKATKCSLQVVASLAFIQTVVEAFAEKFDEGFTPDLTKEPLGDLIKHMNAIADAGSNHRDQTSEFGMLLIRYLRKRYITGYNFTADCRNILSPRILCLQNVEFTSDVYQNRLGFNPMSYCAKGNEEVETALSYLNTTDPNRCLASFSIIIHKQFLSQSLGSPDFKLQERDKSKMKSLPKHSRAFVAKISTTSEDDNDLLDPSSLQVSAAFDPSWMRLSQASTPLHVAQTSVVVHISAVVLSSSNTNVFHQLLCGTESRCLAQLFIPATGRSFTATSLLSTPGRLSSCYCSCGLTICPHSICNLSGDVANTEESLPGYHISKDEDVNHSNNHFLCTKNLCPVAFRVIRVLVHGVLLVGCNINDVTFEYLMQVLRASAMEVYGHLTKCIREDWKILEDLLDSKYEDICILLHSVIKETRDILLTQQYSANDPVGRATLEKDLSFIIAVKTEFLPGNTNQLRKCITNPPQDTSQNVQDITVTNTPSRSEMRFHGYFLFRKEPTIADFTARFVSEGFVFYEKHPFLVLFFKWYKVLGYLKHLPTLVDWNKRISSFLCHRLDRATAQIQTHGSLFDTPQFEADANKRQELKDAFEILKNAWHEVRDGWGILSGDTEEDLQPMIHSKPIELSLFCKNHKDSQLWRMMKVLQNAQNNFLHEVVRLKTSKSNVNLNVRTDKGSHVYLNEVKDYDVIQFDVGDIPLVLHDLATCYIKGEYNLYDFSQIENKLARDIVHHRSIIRDPPEGSFDNFIYADELFHACSAILKDVKEKIKQEKIPREVLNSLQQEQTQNKSFARNVLEGLEILLGMLKKTGGKPEDLLSNYIQIWYSKIPCQLATDLQVVLKPQAMIQLTHVVDLYQTVETFLFEDAVQSLPKEYCEIISGNLQGKLKTKYSSSNLSDLIIIQTTIKRFIFRYLRSGPDSDIDISEGLSSTLSSVHLMPAMTDSERNTITAHVDEEITVSYIKDVLVFIENEIQKHKVEASAHVDRRRLQRRRGRFR